MNDIDVLELKNALAGMAELLATYVEELTKQGFSRAEALAITISYQASIVAGIRPDQ
jgi:hypothetical protein